MFEVLVASDESVETCFFDQSQQSAILDTVPALFMNVRHIMTRKALRYLYRYAFVENDPFQG